MDIWVWKNYQLKKVGDFATTWLTAHIHFARCSQPRELVQSVLDRQIPSTLTYCTKKLFK